jgi:hypothetical protein
MSQTGGKVNRNRFSPHRVSRVAKSRVKCRSKTMGNKKQSLKACKFANDLQALTMFNTMTWDIKKDPESATFSVEGETVKLVDNPKILDFPWCCGEIRLLLPLAKKDGHTSMMVFYQTRVRGGAKGVTFGDLIFTIHNFYHFVHVTAGDLTYIALSNPARVKAQKELEQFYKDDESIYNLSFIQFHDKQTNFGGLIHQHDNLYTLRLV